MKHLILAIICLTSFSMVSQTEKKETHNNKIQGNFVHTVFFWLNNPNNLTERKAFEDGVTLLLDQSKFITSSHIGIPADTATRPVVDDSYTYCVVITFESKKAHDSYQVDPLHTKFVDENKSLWKKVLVYDSVSQ